MTSSTTSSTSSTSSTSTSSTSTSSTKARAEAGPAALLGSLVGLGGEWAALGLSFGTQALERSARSRELAAKTLSTLSHALEQRTASGVCTKSASRASEAATAETSSPEASTASAASTASTTSTPGAPTASTTSSAEATPTA